MKKYQIFGFSLLITVLLIGCGGGSSGSDTTQTQDESTQIGTVLDSQIIGLRYISTNEDKTQIKKGITNSKGEFEYFENGTTEFFVGNIKIGATAPNKMVAITTIAKTDKESKNIARFLQTIDEDGNPDNGIKIPSAVDEHAKNGNVSLKFDDSFDTDFDSVKTELFKHTANIPATISVEQALNHANKSVRLSSLKEFDLYKAISNEKHYRGKKGANGQEGIYNYYNAPVFENDQRKRVYLWIWQKLLSKEMAIEDELQFTKPEFDLNNVEETRDQIKKYLDYADVVAGVQSLGEGAYDNITKAGTRAFGYEVTKLTSLTVGGCSAVVKLYDADNQDSQELSDVDLCKNLMQVLNPVGDPTSKLAVINPILSSFLPEVFPKLLHAKKMNWVHLNTKSLKTISKLKVSKPDVISIALSIANISNDLYGASWASDINEELTTRMVAREWLSIWFRSGFKQEYMNKLINNNSKKLSGTKEQIEAIALKLGSTGALCDVYDFFLPFYKCTGVENINYNYDKVQSIINEKLSKSNALYRNITDLIGSVSDDKGNIGTVKFDWIQDGNLTDSDLIKANLDDDITGQLKIKKMDGTFETKIPSDIIVRFALCEGNSFGFGEDYKGKIQSDGVFSINLNNYSKDINNTQCNFSNSKYGIQLFIDTNKDGTYWFPDGDITIADYTSDNMKDLNITIYHFQEINKNINSSSINLEGKYITYHINTSNGFGGNELRTSQIVNGKFNFDYYIQKDKYFNKEINTSNITAYITENKTNIFSDIISGNYIAILSNKNLDNVKSSNTTLKNIIPIPSNNSLSVYSDIILASNNGKIKLSENNIVVGERGTKEIFISNDHMTNIDTNNLNDVYSRDWKHIHSNSNYNCPHSSSNEYGDYMDCSTSYTGSNYRLLIKDNAVGEWAISTIFDIN